MNLSRGSLTTFDAIEQVEDSESEATESRGTVSCGDDACSQAPEPSDGGEPLSEGEWYLGLEPDGEGRLPIGKSRPGWQGEPILPLPPRYDQGPRPAAEDSLYQSRSLRFLHQGSRGGRKLTEALLALHDKVLGLDAPVPEAAEGAAAPPEGTGQWLSDFVLRARAVPVQETAIEVVGEDLAPNVACYLTADALGTPSEFRPSCRLAPEDAPDGIRVTGEKHVRYPPQFGPGRSAFFLWEDATISTPRHSPRPLSSHEGLDGRSSASGASDEGRPVANWWPALEGDEAMLDGSSE